MLSVPKPASQTNQPLTVFLFTTSHCWSSWYFGLHLSSVSCLWTVIHPVCLSHLSLLYLLAFIFSTNQGASVCLHPSTFGLGQFGAALNLLHSSLTLPFPKLPQCIDCKSDLGGSEAGAEVRIRNKQLYCNSCYMRFKSECLISPKATVACCFCLSSHVTALFVSH